MKHNLYIIKSSNSKGESLIKFGYSSNIKQRIEQYLSHNPFTEIVETFYRQDAFEFEKTFHKNNTSIYKNEWYPENYLIEIHRQLKEGVDNNLNESNKLNKSTDLLTNKICYGCNINKDKKDYQKLKVGKGGFDNYCKKCRSSQQLKYKKRRDAYNAYYRKLKKGEVN